MSEPNAVAVGAGGNGGESLGNQHGSGASPQGPPRVFGEMQRQTSPAFGIGGGGVYGGGLPSEDLRGRSGEPASSRRKRGASETRAEPLRRTLEEASGGELGDFKQFFERMFRFANSGDRRGGAPKNRDCGFLDDRRFEHIRRFEWGISRSFEHACLIFW